MNHREAFEVLGLPESSSKDEIKKTYRKLAGKYHPDKSDGDAERFKKINEAYQFLETGKDFGPSTPPANHYRNDFIDIEDVIRRSGGFNVNPFSTNPFSGQRKKPQQNVSEKTYDVTINFKESVIGCQRPLEFKRNVKCNDCNGDGFQAVNNGCKICKGTGFSVQQHANFIIQTACNSCGGMKKLESCKKCDESGAIEMNTTISYNIPPGVYKGKDVLHLRGIGDYMGSMMGSDHYSNVTIHVNIETMENLKIEGNDVLTTCDISLLDALQGTEMLIPSIDGLTKINIPPKSHNRDEIVLPNLGVNREGNERVIINIKYPEDLTSIINVLNQNKEI